MRTPIGVPRQALQLSQRQIKLLCAEVSRSIARLREAWDAKAEELAELVELLEVLEFAKAKPHAEFTNAERAILRNQRLMMLAVAELMERATSGHLPAAHKLVDRIRDLERILLNTIRHLIVLESQLRVAARNSSARAERRRANTLSMPRPLSKM